MELTVVGCSGSVSGPDSPASCYLVRAPHEGRQFSLLLDLGPGAFGALYRVLDPVEVGAVGLSHLHPDHCLDLCAFHVAARYAPGAPWPAIPVFAPAGAAGRLDSAYAADQQQDEAGPSDTFAFRAWSPQQPVGPFVLTTAAVDHPVPAYAVRILESSTGASLVYSGDTGPSTALVDLARGADLLLCEAGAMEPNVSPGLHLSGRQAGEHAAAAEVGRLVLTHIPPWHDASAVLAEARPSFSGRTELASSGAVWTLG